MRVTRRDVARYANVSEQTVSYILNNKRQFSQEITDRVRNAVEALNYKPDVIARSMSKKSTKSLCIIVNDISNPLFGEIIRAFEKSATKSGYFISFIDVNSDFRTHALNLISRRIEGVYVSLIPSLDTAEFIEELLDAGIKVVVGDNVFADHQKINETAVVVNVDHSEGMREALEYLKKTGRSNVAYLSGLDINSDTDYRYKYFVDQHREIFGKESVVIENEFPFSTQVEDGYRLMDKLFSSGYPCDSIICTNDLIAYGAIESIKKHGKTVGTDIGVIGIDDIFFSKYLDPPLTTIGFDKSWYGKNIFKKLSDYIEHDIKPASLTVSSYLVIRKST